MKIAAVKLYENGFMRQPFAFGGEEEADTGHHSGNAVL